jgi:hypothetical protein
LRRNGRGQAERRPGAWHAARLALSAFARSHGAYAGNHLTLLLRQGQALTLDEALITRDGECSGRPAQSINRHTRSPAQLTNTPRSTDKHAPRRPWRTVTARGWGALTEHHLLVAVRDAVGARPACLQPSLAAALAMELAHGSRVSIWRRTLIVLDEGAPPSAPMLCCCCPAPPQADTAEAAAATRGLDQVSPLGASVHLFLAPPGSGVSLTIDLRRELAGHLDISVCLLRVPVGSGLDAGRSIVALQGHENCGMLRHALTRCLAPG